MRTVGILLSYHFEGSLTYRLYLVIKNRKDYIDIVVRIVRNEIPACLDGFTPRFVNRISEDPGGDQRKPDGPAVIVSRQRKRVVVCAVEQLRLIVPAVGPSGADRMDDVFRLEIEAGGDDRGAGIAVADLSAGGLEPVMSCGPEDRAAHAAAGPQALVRGIDDRVRVQGRDAGFFDRYRFLMLPIQFLIEAFGAPICRAPQALNQFQYELKKLLHQLNQLLYQVKTCLLCICPIVLRQPQALNL